MVPRRVCTEIDRLRRLLVHFADGGEAVETDARVSGLVWLLRFARNDGGRRDELRQWRHVRGIYSEFL
jgi:hypothetical protein